MRAPYKLSLELKQGGIIPVSAIASKQGERNESGNSIIFIRMVFGFSGKALAGGSWGPCTPVMARPITITSMWMSVFPMQVKRRRDGFNGCP